MQKVRWRHEGEHMTGVVIGVYREDKSAAGHGPVKTYLVVYASSGTVIDVAAEDMHL